MYITPLELCLEDALERIGMPFQNRELIHEAHLRNKQSYENLSKDEIEKIGDPQIRAAARRNKAIASNDWDHHLVYRFTDKNRAGFMVTYSVYPSLDNSKLFRVITNPVKYLPTIEHILEERSFWSEEIAVNLNPLREITPELLQKAREEILHGKAHKREIPKREDFDNVNIKRDLKIEFYSNYITMYIGLEVPQDFFKGIRSPVKDATELAKRIANYLKNTVK